MPAITLRTVLTEWLPGWRVSKLKIDAQGSDLGVLSAAGADLLRRVDEVPWLSFSIPEQPSRALHPFKTRHSFAAPVSQHPAAFFHTY